MISLANFIGGLGNQCFQVASIYALAKRNHCLFSLPVNQTVAGGMVNSPCHCDSLFKPFKEMSSKSNLDKNTYVSLSQFAVAAVTPLANENIIIDSMLMNVNNFDEYRDELKTLFMDNLEAKYTDYIQDEIGKHPSNKRVCFAVRRFVEENHPEWASNERYYTNALNYLNIDPSTTVLCVFGDDQQWAQDFLAKYQNVNGIQMEIEYYIGKRYGNMVDYHFHLMAHCDSFILCNSTYHYWPAYFAHTDNATVICPSDIKWAMDYGYPKRWIALDG
jgi:hypothetical protein